MRSIIQRVKGLCSISYDQHKASFEGPGLVVLLGWEEKDEKDSKLQEKEQWIISRCTGLRIFPDKNQKLNLNLSQYLEENSLKGGILWVPQFTLAAELDSGFRPSFVKALKFELAKERFEEQKKQIAEHFLGDPRLTHLFGSFGADMDLSFTNWGPVTIPLSL